MVGFVQPSPTQSSVHTPALPHSANGSPSCSVELILCECASTYTCMLPFTTLLLALSNQAEQRCNTVVLLGCLHSQPSRRRHLQGP